MKSSLLEKMNKKTLNKHLLKNQNRCFIHVDFVLVGVPESTYLESRRTTVENILDFFKPAKFIYLFNFLEMLILSSNPAKNSRKYFDLEALKDKTL